MKEFAVIGNPIKHSLSPIMHEANFKSLHINATYKTMEVEQLADTISDLKILNGFNVTVPYKEEIISYLDEIDETAKLIGAVNTVKCVNGKLIGYNTDAEGFYRSFSDFSLPQSTRILIVGGGGAAKAVYYSLKLNGYHHLTVTNRTIERAKLFSENVISLQAAEEQLDMYCCIINATSVGLISGEAPISMKNVSSHCVVMDLIYNPRETTLLKQANAYGCQTKNGLEMLLYQGAEAFKIWFDQEPNEMLMLKQLEEAIYVNR